MLQIGTTTLPLAGWAADPRHPAESREQRLAAIRHLVQGYGLQVVELTLDLAAAYPHVFETTFYQAVAELQQELGFQCTAHLPFLWVDPASLNESIRQASMTCLQQVIAFTRPVDVQAYVLHLWGFTTMQIAAQLQDSAQRQAILEALMAQAGRSLAEIHRQVGPGTLCVENLEDSLFELALPIIEQQDTAICLDVGHLAMQGGDELRFLARHAHRIREIHLHDAVRPSQGARAPARDHLALGAGQIDYAAFLDKLEQIGYQGPVILELNTRQDLEESLARIGAITATPSPTAQTG